MSDIPRLVTRQWAVDCHHQLISLLKLAVRGLRHAHFLLKREHFYGFSSFAWKVSSHSAALSAVKSGRWHSVRSAQQSPGYTGSRAFAGRPAPAGSQALAFQLVHFQFAASAPRSLPGVRWLRSPLRFALPDGSAAHRDPLEAFDLPATQCGLHQVQVIAGRLIIRFQIALRHGCALPVTAPYRTCLYCSEPPVADAKQWNSRRNSRALSRWTRRSLA